MKVSIVKMVINRYDYKHNFTVSLMNKEFIILDILFRNQITTDVLQSINYLIMEALKSCSNNPISIGVPLV